MTKQIGNTDYDITTDGYVFSRKTDKFISSVKNKSGAIKVNLYYDKKNHQEYVSKLVADAFIEKPDNIDEKDLVVGHKDYNEKNNRVDNLYWTTRTELSKRMHDEGKYVEHLESLKKRIKLINPDDNEVLIFNSLTEAAMYLKGVLKDLENVDIKAIVSNLSFAFRTGNKSYKYLVQTV